VEHVKTDLMPEFDFSQFGEKGEQSEDTTSDRDLRWD
jgi:hypothetical protein